jgi:hypothetical protein
VNPLWVFTKGVIFLGHGV